MSNFSLNWILLAQVLYVIITILVSLRIIYDTNDITKTVTYVLLVIFLPIVGVFVYFSFGINYRSREIYSKKLIDDADLEVQMEQGLLKYSSNILDKSDEVTKSQKKLVKLLLKENGSPLTSQNEVKLLINGEEKFPSVIKAIKAAKNHIHIEYYIFESDTIGSEIINLLIEKAKEGIRVRVIYDDFGSRSIRKKMVPLMRKAGIEAFPFYKIKLIALANRLNYRNHRKIIVIDGKTAFVGGINISDEYSNNPHDKEKLYWRDTHLKLVGPAAWYLQYLFICDWNFCANEDLEPNEVFFPPLDSFQSKQNKLVQIAASGPDSDSPTILYSLLQAINLAKKEILITTPYFIPGESIMDALKIADMSGVNVKILVPGISDSWIVNKASQAYFGELLQVGVEVYTYQKGFVHAKTMVIDNSIAIVGTANMDIRSFDLNFEVNAIVYDKKIATKLGKAFYEDLESSVKIDASKWKNRSTYKILLEKVIRLISPML